MQKYELLTALLPNLKSEDLQEFNQAIQKKIKELKGEFIQENVLGCKALAYSIKKQKYANYVLFCFSLGAENFLKFKKWLEAREGLLRFLIIKVKELKKEEKIKSKKKKEKQVPGKPVKITKSEKIKMKLDEILPSRPKFRKLKKEKISFKDIDKKIDELLEDEEI